MDLTSPVIIGFPLFGEDFGYETQAAIEAVRRLIVNNPTRSFSRVTNMAEKFQRLVDAPNLGTWGGLVSAF